MPLIYPDAASIFDYCKDAMLLKNTFVYEISGPMFFGAADKIMKISLKKTDTCIILRMRSVNAIDATAMHSLEQLLEKCEKKNIKLILSHVNEQPMKVLAKAGMVEEIGAENFCEHIDDAIAKAAGVVNEK